MPPAEAVGRGCDGCGVVITVHVDSDAARSLTLICEDCEERAYLAAHAEPS